MNRFPCLRIATELAAEDSTRASVLNAANEIIVEAFLKRRIRFVEIPPTILSVLEKHKAISKPSFDDILEADNGRVKKPSTSCKQRFEEIMIASSFHR